MCFIRKMKKKTAQWSLFCIENESTIVYFLLVFRENDSFLFINSEYYSVYGLHNLKKNRRIPLIQQIQIEVQNNSFFFENKIQKRFQFHLNK